MSPPYFDWLASIYERRVSPPDPSQLRGRLGLPMAGALLEVGGGTGTAAGPLRPLIGRLVISDLSALMLREARAKCDGRMAQSYAETLPWAEASFERVLVLDALHHFRDQRAAVSELWRVLKPGGRLVLEEVDVTRLSGRLIALAEKLALMGSHFYTPQEIVTRVSDWSPATQVDADGQGTVWVTADKPAR